MLRIITTAALAAILGAGCASLPTPLDQMVPVDSPAAVDADPATVYEPCLDNGGPGVVQVKWENTLDCDLRPPQTLTIVADEMSWTASTGSADGWGGDASMAWADGVLNDAGCTVTWHGGTWAEGTTCDY